MVAGYDPADKADVLYVIVIVSCSPVEVPFSGAHVIQFSLAVIEYERVVPAIEFQTENVCAEALLPAIHDGDN